MQAIAEGDDTVLDSVPAKWYMTEEAADEVGMLQDYVAAVEQHDRVGMSPLHAVAAFDLSATDVGDMCQGWVDWQAFLHPLNNAHAALQTMPPTWGSLSFESCLQHCGLRLGPAGVHTHMLVQDGFDNICNLQNNFPTCLKK